MYRTATLYSADKKVVSVYGGYIPYHVREPIRAFNSEDIFDKQEVRHVYQLPIERWVLDGREFFIALDTTLRDIVDSMIAASEKAVRDICHVRIARLDHEINLLQSRTIWDIIKLKFKRKRNDTDGRSNHHM